jgi:hypothetical protein
MGTGRTRTPHAASTRAAHTPPARTVLRTMWSVLGGVTLLAFVGVVSVLSAGETNQTPTLAEVAGPVTVSGAPITLPLPQQPGAADPAAGTQSPVIAATGYDGQTVTLGAPGAAQVLVLLAHWCPICDQELPTIRTVTTSGVTPDNVELILVTTGLDPSRPNWPPRRWLTDAGLGGVTTVRDDANATIVTAYGLRAYPAWVAIDAQGRVIARHQGQLSTVGVAQLLELAAR